MKHSHRAEALMKLAAFLVFAAAASAAFSGPARAGENVPRAIGAAAKENTSAPLTSQSKAGVKTGDAGYNDFDALSSVNDPLYREGSRQLLRQVVKAGAAAAVRPAPAFRDAPNSRRAPGLKMPRVKKAIPADPVKAKDTI